MRSVLRPLAALAMVLLLGACTGTAATPSAAAKSPAASASHAAVVSPAAKTPRPSSAASPAPVSASPRPSPTIGTTKTPWGRILDAVPSAFPVFPDATVADPPSKGAVSGAWTSSASADEVATWYRDALLGANWAKVDDGGALEDGSHVLDVQGDLPECKAQVTVKPAGGSTMITVLYGAGCVGGGDG